MRVIPRRKRSEERRTGVTIVEHLEELRHRIIVCLYAVAACAVIGWFLFPPFMDLVRKPFCDFIVANPASAPPTGCDLVYNGPLDAMLIKMKVVAYIGVVLALPVLLYQLWGFIAPGLTAKEKKYSVPFVASSVVLFLMGAAVAFVTLPKALNFLLGFAGPGVTPLLTINRYVGFVTLVTIAFSVSFLFPVLIVFLELVGLVTPEWLAKYRRYSSSDRHLRGGGSPSSDPYSMLAMTIPMYLFYEAAIIIGRFLKRPSRTA
jgi:sec-independent protein translocase protein TatC